MYEENVFIFVCELHGANVLEVMASFWVNDGHSIKSQNIR